MPALRIIQDPLDPTLEISSRFAQPIVFFSLDPALPTLLSSHPLTNLRSFCFRLPARQVTRSLVSHPLSVPKLEFLDLSTSNVLEADVELLLGRFVKLRHLILDDCAILRGEYQPGEWRALAKKCAVFGVKRAREREKKLKAWLEALRTRMANDHNLEIIKSGLTPGSSMKPRAQAKKKGRKGLATATISIRDSEKQSAKTVAVQLAGAGPEPSDIDWDVMQRIRILPPAPTLRSLSLTTSATHIPVEKHDEIREEWVIGWNEGLTQLNASRERLHLSARNGVRVVEFADSEELDLDAPGGEAGEQVSSLDEGLNGLRDVLSNDGERWIVDGEVADAPVLCLAGSGHGNGDNGDILHQERCGHAEWPQHGL
jgi:hypothetical protein